MKTVTLLWHTRSDDPEMEDSKLLGVYSSPQSAEQAMAQLGEKPGFADHPEGFLAELHELDKILWAEGFVSVEEL